MARALLVTHREPAEEEATAAWQALLEELCNRGFVVEDAMSWAAVAMPSYAGGVAAAVVRKPAVCNSPQKRPCPGASASDDEPPPKRQRQRRNALVPGSSDYNDAIFAALGDFSLFGSDAGAGSGCGAKDDPASLGSEAGAAENSTGAKGQCFEIVGGSGDA
eukprot:NODE_26274_length_557_cov_1.511628.p2 GENE.NODE_26274_length_557_cov_1.511628~~NODE_26274_length_557_cov_1.511628.p2  ORF type:complete len:180 (+),score=34.43 NODE_26274_length_557_cov_1.511628:56-541(+)